MKFTATKERTEQIAKYNEGDAVLVKFDIRGREYNGNFYVDLNAWRVEPGQGSLPHRPHRVSLQRRFLMFRRWLLRVTTRTICPSNPSMADVLERALPHWGKEELHTAQFENGFRVIYKHVDRPVTHCGLVINAGTRDEIAAQGEAGVAHFIEHTLFKGTRKRKAFHVLNRLDSVGGEFNAYTSKEDTWIYAAFSEQHLERAVELIADITSMRPSRSTRSKERDVILDELNAYLDSPADSIFDEFEEKLFEGHPMGGNILGNTDSVRAMNRATIEGFVARHYHPNEMVFSVVGATPWSKVKRLCEKHFEGFRAELPPQSRPV